MSIKARQAFWAVALGNNSKLANLAKLAIQEAEDEAALAKQEQSVSVGEPVAWRNAAIRVGEDLCSVGPHGYYDMTAEQWLNWALSVVTVHLPPQQRKPLTEEQIRTQFCGNPENFWDYYAGVRYAEAAHGIHPSDFKE